MKKRRRLKNTGKYMLLRNSSILIFVVIFILIGTGYALINTQILIEGKATMLSNTTTNPDESIDNSNSTAKIKLDTSWSKNYMITITINNQDQDYNLWKVSFDVPEGINEVLITNKGDLVTTIEDNTVTVEKVIEDWASSWPLNYENGFLQFHLVFDTDIDFTVSNLIFNGKLITNIEYENMSAPITNEISVMNLTEEETEEENIIKIENNNNVIENNIKDEDEVDIENKVNTENEIDVEINNNNNIQIDNVIENNVNEVNENTLLENNIISNTIR